MVDKPQNDPSEVGSFPSGPEVVSAFIEDLKGQADLDQSVVAVMEKLYVDKKLTSNSLVKGLEEQRRRPKKNP
jgi:hypothetical protein